MLSLLTTPMISYLAYGQIGATLFLSGFAILSSSSDFPLLGLLLFNVAGDCAWAWQIESAGGSAAALNAFRGASAVGALGIASVSYKMIKGGGGEDGGGEGNDESEEEDEDEGASSRGAKKGVVDDGGKIRDGKASKKSSKVRCASGFATA